MATNNAPGKAPRRSLRQWGGFVHMLARFYQDYRRAVIRASKRKKKRAVDIDVQRSKEGTAWGFHWPTLGRNKLHDPKKQFTKNTRIDNLSDEEIDRLRGPNGQKPHRLVTLLELAEELNVRVEVEVKITLREIVVERLLARPKISRMNDKGLLQFKTLAFMGAPNGPINRLRPVHQAGGTTILSFTGFGRRKGISKSKAWPVTDYVRGRAKWTA